MKYLYVLHDAPYGSERTYNALRWARQMLRREAGHEVRIFLFGDAVVSANSGQRTPNGYYNTGKMLQDFTESGGQVAICGSCLDARGLSGDELVKGCNRSSLTELSEWTEWSDRSINV